MGSKTHYNRLENSTQNLETEMRTSTWMAQSYTTNTRTTEIRKNSHSMLQLSITSRSKRQTHVRRYPIRNNAEKPTTNRNMVLHGRNTHPSDQKEQQNK